MSARKLEETDVLKHAKVDKSLSKAIMQARTAKKMTQKEQEEEKRRQNDAQFFCLVFGIPVIIIYAVLIYTYGG